MDSVSERQILDALRTVVDPERGRDVVSLDMVTGLDVRGGHVTFALDVEADRAARLEPLRREAERAVHALPGVLTVTAVLTAERAPQTRAAPPPGPVETPRGRAPILLPDVRAVIAVASGKGGVGKSTTAVNLALALRAIGRSVGLLDADIYGPSLPRLMGIREKPTSADGRRLDPIEKYGIRCMSIGFLVEEETPVIWRGPMVMTALEQMMRDVAWGPLDVLVVDMPPGTGDAQLTMAQRVAMAGAVIVSTPQDIALIDARKGLQMFRKVDVPVLGIVENMSYFRCPHCGERSEIFGHGGARREAERLGVEFLGELPLELAIRETSDAGRPIVATDPKGAIAGIYRAIAERVWAQVERAGPPADKGPHIVVR